MASQLRASRVPIIAIYLLLLGLFLVFFLHFFNSKAQAANPNLINFQGKVVNSDGTNVTNNSYTFRFCLYATATPATPCTVAADNDAIWRESKSLSTTSSIFQTNLGDVTTLPNFNTYPNLYLGINFNADAAGEMTPRIRLTSVPYALNSDALSGLVASNFVQLAQGIQTDASTTNASIGVNKTGSTANILLLQRSGADVMVIANDGAVTFKNQTNSTTAFQIQNAVGTNLLNADTLNHRLAVNQGQLHVTGFGIPAAPTLAAGSNQGGSLSGASGTIYYYKVSALNASGESLGSTEASIAASSFTVLTPPGAPTVAVGAAGTLTGTFQYRVTFVTANGETTGGTLSAAVTVSAQQVVLSAIPTGPTDTTQRKLYRCTSAAGACSAAEALTATIADNTTTTHNDDNGAPSGALPGANTARTNLNNATVTFTPITGATSYRIYRSTSTGSGYAYQTTTASPFTDTGATGTVANPPASSTIDRVGIGTSAPTANLHVAGTALFQNAENSTTAFQVQNAAGTALLSVNTRTSTFSSTGFVSLQPAANLEGGQTHITQTLTNASSTGGTVNGYSQTITVAPTTSPGNITNGQKITITTTSTLSGDNNTGVDITVTDNGSNGHASKGLKVRLDGSNTSVTGIGVDSLVQNGVALKGTSTGAAGGNIACGNTQTATFSIGVCGATFVASSTAYGGLFTAEGNGGTALYATNSTTTSNIIKLQDNTSDVLLVADGGSTTLSPVGDVTALTVKQTSDVTTPTRNILNVQNSAGTASFFALNVVSGTPHLRVYGSDGVKHADIYYDDATNTAYYGASTGTAVLGSGTGAVNVTAGASAAFTITGNAASSISTTAGNLSLQGGSGTVQIASSILSGSGALTVQSGGATALTISSGAALVIDAATASTIQIGDGTNNLTLSGTTREPNLAGTARHTRRIIVPAEYAGASMTADGTSNTGTMTSDNMAVSPFRNFYKWLNTQATAQDYDIWVRVPIPTDYSALPTGQTICMDTYASATTANTVMLTLYDTSNAVVGTTFDLTPTATNTWQNRCTTSITAGTYAANGIMTLDIKLTAPATTGDVRISNFYLDYLSKW